MFKHIARLALMSSLVFAAACGTDTSGTTDRLTIDTRCAVDTDCPTSFQCEVEIEHGVTTSVCQSDDPSATCPAGYESELEHGQTFCKPHGGDGGGSGGGSDGGADGGVDGGADGGAATCTVDADCPAGQECEVEVEHGQTTSFCKPHGGA